MLLSHIGLVCLEWELKLELCAEAYNLEGVILFEKKNMIYDNSAHLDQDRQGSAVSLQAHV